MEHVTVDVLHTFKGTPTELLIKADNTVSSAASTLIIPSVRRRGDILFRKYKTERALERPQR